jgi:hypothetical protein
VEKNPVKMEENPVCMEKNPVKMEKILHGYKVLPAYKSIYKRVPMFWKQFSSRPAAAFKFQFKFI